MDLYYAPISPPCQAVMHTINALGLKVNYRKVNLGEKEQMRPRFLALNPQHTVPTFVDGDFSIWESRAVSAYLVNQHGKDDSLYPKDPQKRAMVDKALFFDMGTLYKKSVEFAVGVIMRGEKPDPDKKKACQDAIALLNKALAKRLFVAGDEITIADHFVMTTIGVLNNVADQVGLKMDAYPNVMSWYARAKAATPKFEEVEKEAAEAFAVFVKSRLAAA